MATNVTNEEARSLDIVQTALKQLDKALDSLRVVQTQIGEHIVKCSSLQEAAQEWRKQINQRVIEIQLSQQKHEKQLGKTSKKFDKRLSKTVDAFQTQIDTINKKQQKWQMAQLSALCAILLTILGYILSESIKFSATIPQTQTEIHHGR